MTFPSVNSSCIQLLSLTVLQMCVPLRVALDVYFPESSGVRIIAEPGRYFVASAFTLATNIIAKRVINRDDQSSGKLTSSITSVLEFFISGNSFMFL